MEQKAYKTLFFGTPDFAVPVLETLITLPYVDLQTVFTQPDKPVGRKQTLTPPPVKVVAEKNNIQILQPETTKTEKFKEQLNQLAPDLIIVVAYGKIIPENLLTTPKYGWLNVHASLLPKYRGASPIQQAILDGESQTGVTLMKIDAGLDTGPIIAQKTIDIQPNDNFESLHDKLSQLGADLVKESLLNYLEGKLNPQAQDNSQATTTKIIKKEDGHIDWSKSAKYIEQQIRAFTPWPGAFCFWSRNTKNEQKEMTNSHIEQRLKIIEATVSKDATKLSPGQTKTTNNTIIIGCSQSNLELKKIQLEGKKPQSVADFLKGYPKFGQVRLN